MTDGYRSEQFASLRLDNNLLIRLILYLFA